MTRWRQECCFVVRVCSQAALGIIQECREVSYSDGMSTSEIKTNQEGRTRTVINASLSFLPCQRLLYLSTIPFGSLSRALRSKSERPLTRAVIIANDNTCESVSGSSRLPQLLRIARSDSSTSVKIYHALAEPLIRQRPTFQPFKPISSNVTLARPFFASFKRQQHL